MATCDVTMQWKAIVDGSVEKGRSPHCVPLWLRMSLLMLVINLCPLFNYQCLASSVSDSSSVQAVPIEDKLPLSTVTSPDTTSASPSACGNLPKANCEYMLWIRQRRHSQSLSQQQKQSPAAEAREPGDKLPGALQQGV